MSKKRKSKKPTRRQELREKRKRQEQRQRILIILGILVAALVIMGVILAPNILESQQPVGEYKQITPGNYPLADRSKLGDPNAPVLIEVFEDFKCIACQGYSTQIEPLVIDNHVAAGEVYYIFYQYPFLDDRSSVKDSDRAAAASLCAREQDRFWDYKKMLFENYSGTQNEFNNKRLVAFAESLGLDSALFTECLEDNIYSDEITDNIALAIEKGVTGTPSIFVNGINIKPGYVPSYEEIKAAIEAEIASSES
jgi:protein-disulfide isomerase